MQRARGSAARYRPGKALPLAIGTALLAVMAGIVVVIRSSGEQAAATIPPRPATQVKTPADRAERAMPPGEQSFIAAIERGKAAFAAGTADAEKVTARATRASDICRAVPNPHFFAWSGVVDAVSADAAGPPFVSIEIAPNTHLTTRSDAASGLDASAAIDRYALPALATLQPGQAVAFSGIFRPARLGDADCYKQAMPAPDDAMTAPVFVIGLYSIAGLTMSTPTDRSR